MFWKRSCSADPQRCALGPGRTYADPEIEALYQTTLQYDSEARLWLSAVRPRWPAPRCCSSGS